MHRLCAHLPSHKSRHLVVTPGHLLLQLSAGLQNVRSSSYSILYTNLAFLRLCQMSAVQIKSSFESRAIAPTSFNARPLVITLLHARTPYRMETSLIVQESSSFSIILYYPGGREYRIPFLLLVLDYVYFLIRL